MRSIIVKVLLLALMPALVIACGNDTENPSNDDSPPPVASSSETIIPTPTPAGEVDNNDLTIKPLVTIPEASPPLGLEIEDLVLGEGDPVTSGDFLIMDYVGVSYSTGLQFDASWG